METNDNIENTSMMENEEVLIAERESMENIIERDKEVQSRIIFFAGFWMRFWAYLFDLIVIGSLNRILIKPIFHLLKVPTLDFNIFSTITITTATLFYLYFVLMTKYFGQTLGKMVFGLKVVDLKGEKLSWGTILFREWIGRFISSTIVIGYIIAAFLPKKQGLHDVFADTTVIHEER